MAEARLAWRRLGVIPLAKDRLSEGGDGADRRVKLTKLTAVNDGFPGSEAGSFNQWVQRCKTTPHDERRDGYSPTFQGARPPDIAPPVYAAQFRHGPPFAILC